MFLHLHHSLYSILQKKCRKVQNLGAVEFCPLLGCKYDVFATLPVPIQSSAKKKMEKCKILEQLSFVHCQIAYLTFLRIHHSLLSLWQKKYRKVQNLRVVEFCQFFSCMYDIFVSSLLPIQSSVKKNMGKCIIVGQLSSVYFQVAYKLFWVCFFRKHLRASFCWPLASLCPDGVCGLGKNKGIYSALPSCHILANLINV